VLREDDRDRDLKQKTMIFNYIRIYLLKPIECDRNQIVSHHTINFWFNNVLRKTKSHTNNVYQLFMEWRETQRLNCFANH